MNFKAVATSALLGFSMVLGASSYANAATQFDFSYAFVNDSGVSTGDSISGSFFGTLVGQDVTNISNVTASFFDGTTTTPLAGPLEVYSYTPTSANCGTPACFTLDGNAVASFDPTHNDFVFIDSPPDGSNHLTSYTNYFYIIQPWANGGPGSTSIATQYRSFPTNTLVENYNGDYIAANWSLTAVPEPATWAMMLIGFGAVGFMLRGSRQKSLASTA
jgi:hypothetical protein